MTEQSTIFAALAKAQSEMGKALKSAANLHFKSKYADLSEVMDACLPALNANSIAVFQPMRESEGARYVVTILAHASGECIECAVPLIVQKDDMQGLGSAITYARRYGLMSMAGIAPEDDDGNAAAKAAPKGEPRQPAQDYSRAIAKIEAATTGRDLLAAVKEIGKGNDQPAVASARIGRLRTLVKGAPTLDALDAMQKHFTPDWPQVSDDAAIRREELQPDAGDVLQDEAPY